jgi:hypothetical protein
MWCNVGYVRQDALRHGLHHVKDLTTSAHPLEGVVKNVNLLAFRSVGLAWSERTECSNQRVVAVGG